MSGKHAARHAEESASVHEHRSEAPAAIAAAIITVSDTRNLETDQGGALIEELLEKSGIGGRERVLAHFTQAQVAGQTVAVYRDMAKRAGR